MANEMSTLAEINNLMKSDASYNSQTSVRQAEEDFKYLCTRQYYSVLPSQGLLAVSKSAKHVLDVQCIPVDLGSETPTTFPRDRVAVKNPKMYIAAVCYKDGKATDVLLFHSSLFDPDKKESAVKGFMGKIMKKKKLIEAVGSEYMLNIKDANPADLRKYSFAYVMGHLQEPSQGT